MSRRISRQTLEARIQTINEMAGTPTHSWTIISATITSAAYSPGDRHGTRYSLEQMSASESGGVRTVLPLPYADQERTSWTASTH